MTFKEKIVNLRKIKGLTQDEFAKAVGVSRQAVYKWDSGQSYPEVPKILEIKLLFNISIDDLLDDSFEVPLPEKKKRKRLEKKVREKIEEASEAKEEPKQTLEVADEEPAPVYAEAEAPAKEEMVAAPVEDETPAQENDEPAKKKGFFGRLFGRK